MLDTPYAEQQQVLGNTSWDMVDMSYAEHRQVLGNTSWDGAYPNPDENKEWRKANSQQWWKSEACRSVQHEVCLPCEVKKGLSQHTPRTYQKIPQRRPWKKKNLEYLASGMIEPRDYVMFSDFQPVLTATDNCEPNSPGDADLRGIPPQKNGWTTG